MARKKFYFTYLLTKGISIANRDTSGPVNRFCRKLVHMLKFTCLTLALPREGGNTPTGFLAAIFFPDGVNKIASVEVKPYHFDTFLRQKAC